MAQRLSLTSSSPGNNEECDSQRSESDHGKPCWDQKGFPSPLDRPVTTRLKEVLRACGPPWAAAVKRTIAWLDVDRQDEQDEHPEHTDHGEQSTDEDDSSPLVMHLRTHAVSSHEMPIDGRSLRPEATTPRRRCSRRATRTGIRHRLGSEVGLGRTRQSCSHPACEDWVMSPSFQVGASVRSVSGGGHLIVEQDYVALEPGRLTRRVTHVERVVQGPRTIQMIRGRLLPPWMNTHFVISDGDETALAGVPGWSRRGIVRQLQQAGFSVEEEVSSFSRGAERIRPWP